MAGPRSGQPAIFKFLLTNGSDQDLALNIGGALYLPQKVTILTTGSYEFGFRWVVGTLPKQYEFVTKLDYLPTDNVVPLVLDGTPEVVTRNTTTGVTILLVY